MLSIYLSRIFNTPLPLDNKIWYRNTVPFINQNIKIGSLTNQKNGSLVLDEVTGNLFVRINERWFIVDNFYSKLTNYTKSFINVYDNIGIVSNINVPNNCKILNIILLKGIEQKSINLIVDGYYSYLIDNNGNIYLYRNGTIIFSFINS